MKKKLAIYRNGSYWHVKEKTFWGMKWAAPTGCGRTKEAAIANYMTEAQDIYCAELPTRDKPEIIEVEVTCK